MSTCRSSWCAAGHVGLQEQAQLCDSQGQLLLMGRDQWGTFLVTSPELSDQSRWPKLMGCTIQRGQGSCSAEAPVVKAQHSSWCTKYLWVPSHFCQYKVLLHISCQRAGSTSRGMSRAAINTGSVTWIIRTKQEPGKQLHQPPLCVHHTSSQVRSLPGAWDSPKDWNISNRNVWIDRSKVLREVSLCDWAPEEIAEQRVKCIDTAPCAPRYLFQQ